MRALFLGALVLGGVLATLAMGCAAPDEADDSAWAVSEPVLALRAPDAGGVLEPPLDALWAVEPRPPCHPSAWLPTRVQFSRYSDDSGVAFMLFSSAYSDETTWEGLDSWSLQTGERPLGLLGSPSTTIVLQPALWRLADDGSLVARLSYEDTTGAPVCSVNVTARLEP